MTKPENFLEEKESLNGKAIKVTSYKIGHKYYCHISNVDPDATIARADAESLAEAKKIAKEKALKRLSH